MIEYKSYTAVVEYEPEEESFHGRVANIRDVITFYGRSVEELKRGMAASIEDYLAFCKQEGLEPAKPYSGRFNVRMDPEMHRAVAMAAASSGKSMNDWVVDALERATHERSPSDAASFSAAPAKRKLSSRRAGSRR